MDDRWLKVPHFRGVGVNRLGLRQLTTGPRLDCVEIIRIIYNNFSSQFKVISVLFPI